MKISKKVSMSLIVLFVGTSALFGVRGGYRGGGARGVRTTGSTRAVTTRVASPRVGRTATVSRQVTRQRVSRPATRTTQRSVAKRGGRGGGRHHNGRHHGGRRYRRHHPRHGYAFWLGFPLAYQYYYTAFDNSCIVFNDTNYDITVYTATTPRLSVPAGEFVYLPCGQLATIVSPRGTITANVFDRMSVATDGGSIFID